MMIETKKPLVGAELLSTCDEMEKAGASKSEMVRACGYLSIKKDGSERLNFAGFYEAWLSALGKLSKSKVGSSPARGRRLSYETSVLNTGNVVIGRRYIQELGLQPGDVLSIKTNRGRVTLAPVGKSSDSTLLESMELDESQSDGSHSDERSVAPMPVTVMSLAA